MIRINSIVTNVEPKFRVMYREKGVMHDLQDGSINCDVTKVKFDVELLFTLLSQAEFDALELLKMTEGYSSSLFVTLTLNERIFDSATTDTKLNRILNKMKVVDFEPEPMTPYEDDDTSVSLRMLLREV